MFPPSCFRLGVLSMPVCTHSTVTEVQAPVLLRRCASLIYLRLTCRHAVITRRSDEDLQQMQRVIGYVHRHMAQRPKKPQSVEELENTKWAKSLKNWAHDPGKDEPRAQE